MDQNYKHVIGYEVVFEYHEIDEGRAELKREFFHKSNISDMQSFINMIKYSNTMLLKAVIMQVDMTWKYK